MGKVVRSLPAMEESATRRAAAGAALVILPTAQAVGEPTATTKDTNTILHEPILRRSRRTTPARQSSVVRDNGKGSTVESIEAPGQKNGCGDRFIYQGLRYSRRRRAAQVIRMPGSPKIRLERLTEPGHPAHGRHVGGMRYPDGHGLTAAERAPLTGPLLPAYLAGVRRADRRVRS